jgi:two-component system nitrate/nitrite response regulator NarL
MAASKHTIRIAIAGDYAMFREGLCVLLEACKDFSVVGEASDAEECFRLLAKLQPDILLVDWRMPGLGGLGLLEQINWQSWPTRVIALIDAKNHREAASAMRSGARGIVQKQSAGQELIKIIRRVYSREVALDESMSANAMDEFPRPAETAPPQKSLLSDREREIVHHVAQGFRNREIAQKLFIAEQTVKNYVHDIFDKLGVSDRLELALYAVNHQWFEETTNAVMLSASSRTRPKG